jgi:hypothetical protein
MVLTAQLLDSFKGITTTNVQAISTTQGWFYLSVEKDTRKDIKARSEYLPAMWTTRQHSGSYSSKNFRR